jgi:hypothetical protein
LIYAIILGVSRLKLRNKLNIWFLYLFSWKLSSALYLDGFFAVFWGLKSLFFLLLLVYSAVAAGLPGKGLFYIFVTRKIKMHIRAVLFILTVFSLFFCFTSCQENSKEILIEKVSLNSEQEITGLSTRTKGGAHSGQYFSRMNKDSKFGIGYAFYVADSIKNKNIKVILEGWGRISAPQSKASIVITTNHNDSLLKWNPLWLNYNMVEPNTWCYFKDSMVVPKPPWGISLTSIKVFGYLGESASESFDLDDLSVTFKIE